MATTLEATGTLLRDPLQDDLATGALGYTSHGGLEPGEVYTTCARIRDGDDGSWYDAWCALADRLTAVGDVAAGGGHRVSAGEAYLRAVHAYGLAYKPLFGAASGQAAAPGHAPDGRLRSAFRRQQQAFGRVAEQHDPAGEPLEIPFGDATLPAYLFRASAGAGTGPRPLVVTVNGYDATLADMYYAHAAPALRRGYHCLLVDGPGQGAVLYEQGMPLRPDWDTVVGAVLDAVLDRPGVDPSRVALVGWSLGGLLALRAAAGEPRIAACVADPGLYSIPDGMRAMLRHAGVPEDALAGYPEVDPAALAPVAEAIHADRRQRWRVEQRGYWVHGVSDLAGYLRAVAPFTLAGYAERITCPTLLTQAADDPLAASAETTYADLGCPKTLVRFTGDEGAGGHCELPARSVYDQRVYDWLDETLPG